MKEKETIEQRLERIEGLLAYQKSVLNLEEVASYTGLSKSFIYKLTSSGGIPCYKPNGKHIYFDRNEVDNWLLSNRLKTNEEIDQETSTKIVLGK